MLAEVSENGAGPLSIQPPAPDTAEYPTDGKTVVVPVEATQAVVAPVAGVDVTLRRHLPEGAATMGETQVGPRTTDTTVLFADLKGFTDIADHLPAVEVARVLNLVLDEMVKVVFELRARSTSSWAIGSRPCGGRPKTAGTTLQMNATRAIQAALTIAARIPALETGIPPLGVCVGVHCGDAVTGFLGRKGGRSSPPSAPR